MSINRECIATGTPPADIAERGFERRRYRNAVGQRHDFTLHRKQYSPRAKKKGRTEDLFQSDKEGVHFCIEIRASLRENYVRFLLNFEIRKRRNIFQVLQNTKHVSVLLQLQTGVGDLESEQSLHQKFEVEKLPDSVVDGAIQPLQQRKN